MSKAQSVYNLFIPILWKKKKKTNMPGKTIIDLALAEHEEVKFYFMGLPGHALPLFDGLTLF